MSILAVFQLSHGMNKFYRFISSTTRSL